MSDDGIELSHKDYLSNRCYNLGMEYCNACRKSVNDPQEHKESKEHKESIDRIEHMFDGKEYDDGRIGIEP